ncbi:hypothetical protein [Porphyromonas levii]|nr:hypothetical protein [Porphyromonas levii]
MRYVKRILKIGVLIGILSLIGIFAADRLVEKSASEKVIILPKN